MKTKSRERKRK